MALALAADRTSTIGLGPAVLVPALRHPMVNAAAIATLAALAPGRVAVAIGAGFTGRFTLGQSPMQWADVAAYVRTLRALLRGEEAVWEGAVMRMIHPPGFVTDRPIDVPILVGADGPKGRAVARELGDGLISAVLPAPDEAGLPTWRAMLTFGTVLDDGESLVDDRVIDAAGHAVAVAFHNAYERQGEGVDQLPGGRGWRRRIEQVDAQRRHLAIHEDHLVKVPEADLEAVKAGVGVLPILTMTGTAAELREKAQGLADAGVTELVYQPAGRNIAAELERMAAALRG